MVEAGTWLQTLASTNMHMHTGAHMIHMHTVAHTETRAEIYATMECFFITKEARLVSLFQHQSPLL